MTLDPLIIFIGDHSQRFRHWYYKRTHGKWLWGLYHLVKEEFYNQGDIMTAPEVDAQAFCDLINTLEAKDRRLYPKKQKEHCNGR